MKYRQIKMIKYLITWTWALIMRVSASINPSKTFESSINFFQPQSCSFFQNRCSVSAEICNCVNKNMQRFFKIHCKRPNVVYPPEYLDFLGSLFTTAIVNWAKWLQPALIKRQENINITFTITLWRQFGVNYQHYHTWKELVMISHTHKQREMIADITSLRVN